MQSQQALAEPRGVTPSRAVRPIASVLLLAVAFFAALTVTTGDAQASPLPAALSIPSPTALRALVPSSLATAVTDGVGTVSAALATAAGSAVVTTSANVAADAAVVGGAGAAGTAAAPVALAVGAAIVAGSAVYLGWKWASGHTGTEYDVSATSAGLSGWSCPAGTCGMTFRTAQLSGGGSLDYLYTATVDCGCTMVLQGFNTSTQTWGQILTRSGWEGLPQYQSWKNFVPGANVNSLRIVMNSSTSPTFGYSAVAGTTPGTNVATTTPRSQCSNGTTVTGTAVTYTGGAAASTLPALLLPACPAGTTRTGATFTTTAPGVSNPPQPLANWTPAAIPSGFPECNVVGESCQLNLFRVGHGTGLKHNCQDGGCEHWQTETQPVGQRVTVKRLTAIGTGTGQNAGDDMIQRQRMWADGDTVECDWGPYVVDQDGCVTVPTDPATDAPAKAPVDVPGGAGAPSSSNPDTEHCYPTGWAAFNPLEWVYKPVKCVLIWAFIPDPAAVDAMTAHMSDAWSASIFGVFSSAAHGFFDPIGSLSSAGTGDCNGPSFTFQSLGGWTLQPFAACDGIVATVSTVTLAFESFMVYSGGLFLAFRLVVRTIGFTTPEEA